MSKQKKTFRPKARRPKGFEDRFGALASAENALIGAATKVYHSHGFEPLSTSALEYADCLGKFLPDDDRPNEGVFAFTDDDQQWMALRYDLTAPLARFVAENYDPLPKPLRRFAVGPVWRNEKPGPGRFREFIQIDADTVGAPGAAADAEMIMLAADVMAAAGLANGEYVIRVNNRKLLDAILGNIGVADTEDGALQRLRTLRAIDKLDRLGPDAVAQLLGEGRKDASGDYTKGAGLSVAGIKAVLAYTRAGHENMADTLAALHPLMGASEVGKAGMDELQAIASLLEAAGYDDGRTMIDPSIVRGLGYYTGPVFEADLKLETVNDKGEPARFGSAGGGGRYDDLIARFRGQPVPATGFSFGVSRFAAALHAMGRLGGQDRGPVVILALEADQMAHYFAMATELRTNNIRAEVYMGGSGMKAQMKYADKRGAPAVVIVGEDERAAGDVTVKNLVLGQHMAGQITDNKEWREGRPAQVSGPRETLLAMVRDALN
jgi:histidyl-tRNA synthetase